jgi:hypothetical protein
MAKIAYLIVDGKRKEVHRAETFAFALEFLCTHHPKEFLRNEWVVMNGDALAALAAPKGLRS